MNGNSNQNLLEHERAAVQAVVTEVIGRMDSSAMSIAALVEHGWIAGRKYEPPRICDSEFWWDDVRLRCEHVAGHIPQTDHRHTFESGAYVGWKG